MSNTDAFNRSAELEHQYAKPTLEPRGLVVHHGSFARLGQTLRWRELAFRFVAPDRFHCERIFEGGPVASLTAEFKIQAVNGGTDLEYELLIQPRYAWLQPLLALEARFVTRPTLERTLDTVAEAVQQGLAHFNPPPPLPARQAELLDRQLGSVTAPGLRDALRALIHEAPLREQDRIQPLALAERIGVPAGEVVDACLQAVEAEVLEARFLLLCPRCLGAKETVATIDFSSRQVHCDTCNIGYDGALADNVELAFRPAEQVRAFSVVVDCIQSPSFTPHVVAQEALAAGGWLTFDVELAPGCYRIETSGGGDPMHLEVVPEGAASLTADVVRGGLYPRRAEVRAGMVSLYLRNRTPDRLLVTLADQARPANILTVGAFLQHGRARSWAEIHQGLQTALTDGIVVVQAEAPFAGGTGPSPEKLGALHVQQANGRTLAVFPSLESALSAVVKLSSNTSTLAISRGSMLTTRGPFGEVALGESIDRATALVRRVGWGRIAVDTRLAEDAALHDLIAAEYPSLELVPGWGARPALLRHSALAIAARLDVPDAPPARLGPYAVGQEIGRGGMGVVYLATHEDTGEEIVVKVLEAAQSRDVRYVAAFYEEARLGWTIDHPNVVRVLDWGADPETGRLFLAMEKLDGPNLLQLIRQGTLSSPAVLDLTRDLLEGLAAIHDAGVIHRDIKPANVMSTPRGAVILDFGIAHRADVRETAFAGSVLWMSPEQGGQRGADARSDLYQLALVLCFAATGRSPFPEQEEMDSLVWRTRHELTELPPGIPPPLTRVLLRALRRNPDERYATAHAMRSEVHR